jgi:hypothetical protein
LSGGGPVVDLSLRPEFESKANLGLVDAVAGQADIQIGEHVSIVKLNEKKKVKNLIYRGNNSFTNFCVHC